MKRLIVNADDFGLTEGVTRAIVECHIAGSVTSTTLMVNMPATPLAVELAHAHPELGVGLHFTLTLGRPVGDPAGVGALLQSDGRFRGRRAQEFAIAFGRVPRAVIAAELRAQLTRMRNFGLQPTHIDSHQHIHAVPRAFDVVAETAESEGLPVRLPRRWRGRSRQPLGKLLKGQVLRAFTAYNARKWRGRLITTEGHCSIFDIVGSNTEVTGAHYRELLAAESGVVELMVHPGPADDETSALIGIAQLGLSELRVLRTPEFHSIAEACGFALCHFGAVLPKPVPHRRP